MILFLQTMTIVSFLLFAINWYVIYWNGSHISEMALVLCALCQVLSTIDVLSPISETYWAFMFSIWGSFLVFYSLAQFNISEFQIACWTYSSVCWQCIRFAHSLQEVGSRATFLSS